MIKINNFFFKAFIVLGLSGFIDQNLKANDEKKRAFITLVREVFVDHEYIQRVFSQDLDMMGVEKSPLESEIMNWNTERQKVEKKRRIKGIKTKKNKFIGYNDGKIFEALVLKAVMNFFDNKNEHLEKEEPCLDFNETNVNKNLLDESNKENFCSLMDIELYPLKFLSDFLQNQQKITNKEEKIRYFFQNFNAFIEDYDEINFYFSQIKNILENHLRFIALSCFTNLPSEFDYLNLLIKTYEGLLHADKEIADHFSDNFFKKFNQRIFAHFSDIEYIFFLNYFFTVNPCIKDIFTYADVTFDYLEPLLNKNIIFSNLNKNIIENTFTITEDNLGKILKAIVAPLKGLFFYRHTLRLCFNIFSLKDTQNFNKNIDSIVNRLEDGEFKEIKYLVTRDLENVYIKKALQVAYKIFFISFLEESSSFRLLSKFKAVDYNSYLFKLKNKIKTLLTKEEMNLHENFYTSKDGFNFALCAKSQFKCNGHTRNFISFASLEYFVGSDDSFDIFRDKDDQFFKKMEESLKPLSISLVPECLYIRDLALKRIQFLKNTLEKIKLTKTILPQQKILPPKKIPNIKKRNSQKGSEDLVIRINFS